VFTAARPLAQGIPIKASIAIAAAFAAVVFAVDAFVMLDSAIAVLYVAVVLISSSVLSGRGTIAVGVGCCLLTLAAFLIQHTPYASEASVGRGLVSLLAIVIATFLAVRIRSTTAELAYQARLLDLTHDAVFVRDMHDTVTFWNRGAENLYGWPREDAIGRKSQNLTLTSTAPDDIMATLLATGHWEGELIDTRRDGSRVTVSSRWALVRDQRGEPTSILETNTDIEAHKQAQDTLAQAQAELAHVSRVSTLGELTASIAHEINQPLAAIVTRGETCLRWLQQPQPRIDEVNRSIERMIGDGRRASEIVKRLRALTRKDAMQTAPIAVNEMIEEAVILIPRELASHGVSLELDLAPGLPAALGDRVQLQQVIINLLMNAIQAMDGVQDRSRELVLRSRTDDSGAVVISVCDTGPGFHAEAEGRLFDAFFTTKKDGMGMGLSICRSIIEAHGGRIWASRNDGHGATFHFTLPSHGNRQQS
jgi:PAS domain S-box-containing protein